MKIEQAPQPAHHKITDAILEKLDQGVVPWRKPWKTRWPQNIDGWQYRGINVLTLALAAYSSPYWMTFNQAKKLGGHVKRGQRSTPVLFWEVYTKELENDDTGEIETSHRVVARYWWVFNLEQTDGIPQERIPAAAENMTEFRPIEKAARIIDSMPNRPVIEYGKQAAFYSPAQDRIGMPDPERFTAGPESFYSTLYHEAAHWSGHPTRLARFSLDDHTIFGSESYSQEELVAEITAAFLCGEAGISPATLDQSAAYIAGWLKRLRGDKKLIVIAAAQAQKAADLILGRLQQDEIEAT